MENPSPADSSLAIIFLLCLIIYNMCMNELSIFYFLYGLHAATTLRSSSIFLPRTVPSHMISLIRLTFSDVLASSKNKTVPNTGVLLSPSDCVLILRLSTAISSAFLTAFSMSCRVVPP